MPFISEDTLREIREKVSILHVISPFVKLRKVGANHVGLCPFHSEKTPSFTVHEGKGMFHCFGCGVGGNIFTFLMRHSNMSFPEAAEELAKKAGIRMTTAASSREGKRAQEEREKLRHINTLALKFFQNTLMNSPAGEEAREYLKQRGIPDDAVSVYALGCAPNLWNGFLNHLGEKKIDPLWGEKAGLLIRKSGGGYYDRFRHRVMFPIHDISGKIVGFGGRALGGEEPKYLNSSDTLLFSKGKVLFGLHIAREHLKKEDTVIIVEGYFDLLSLHIHGFKNSAATLGTGLTSDHVDLLRRHVQNVVVAFDPDEGGRRAAERSLRLFLEKDVDARILLLPDGNDPDVYLRRHGREKFLSLLRSAPPLADYVIEECARRHGGSIQGKSRAVDELVPLLHVMGSPVMKDLYIKKIAETVAVREEAVRECYRRPTSSSVSRPAREPQKEKGYSKAEEEIIRLMVQHAEAVRRVKESGALASFRSQSLKALGEKFIEDYDRTAQPPLPDRMINDLEDEGQRALLSRLAVEGGPFSDEEWEDALDDSLSSLHRARLREEHRAIVQEMKKAEENGDEARIGDLLARKSELMRKEKGVLWPKEKN